jgi:hypothetical protein
MRSIYLQSFMLISLIVLEKCPGQSSSIKMDKGQKLQNKARQSYGSLSMHFNTMRSIYLQSFLLISLIDLEKCPGQSSKCKNEQRAITPKLGKTELWFFSAAFLLNEIYLPTQFHVDISYSFRVMSRTKFNV